MYMFYITYKTYIFLNTNFNSLNAELNPIWHLLSLLGTHPILHISRISLKEQNFKITTVNKVIHFKERETVGGRIVIDNKLFE